MYAKSRCFLRSFLVLFVLVLFASGVHQLHAASPDQPEEQVSVIIQVSDNDRSIRNVAQSYAKRQGGTVQHIYDNVLHGFAIQLPASSMTSLSGLQRDSKGKAPKTIWMDRKTSLNASVRPISQSENSDSPKKKTLGSRTQAEHQEDDLHQRRNTTVQDSDMIPLGIEQVRADEVEVDHPHSGVDVVVIDTGIDRNHPDLTQNLRGGVNVTGNGTSSEWDDDHGHGTHVAGTIGAPRNNEGVVGIAPKVNLYACKAFGPDGEAKTSDIIAGINWAADDEDHPSIEVVNMSFTAPAVDRNSVYRTAITDAQEAGVAFSAAAGNASTRVREVYPARMDEVVTVSAYGFLNGEKRVITKFSNYGPEIDITAPGVDVPSTYPGGHYRKMTGTSMAAPHVSGALALLRGANPNVSPEKAQTLLIERANDEATLYEFKHINGDGISEPKLDAKSAAQEFRDQQEKSEEDQNENRDDPDRNKNDQSENEETPNEETSGTLKIQPDFEEDSANGPAKIYYRLSEEGNWIFRGALSSQTKRVTYRDLPCGKPMQLKIKQTDGNTTRTVIQWLHIGCGEEMTWNPNL